MENKEKLEPKCYTYFLVVRGNWHIPLTNIHNNDNNKSEKSKLSERNKVEERVSFCPIPAKQLKEKDRQKAKKNECKGVTSTV